MAVMGAPSIWPLTNALVAAFIVVAWFVPRPWSVPPLAMAIAALIVLAATFVGPNLDNVHRWIAIGPLRLHAGMLALPLLGILLPQLKERFAAAAVILAALIFALQPDRASAAALFCMVLIWLMLARHRWALLALLAATASLIRTTAIADTLSPVPFVENVLHDASAWNAVVAIAMAVALVIACLTPIWIARKQPLANLTPRAIWSAGLVGYSVASLFGAYPTPLLGYGVSPILGFGLALALLAAPKQANTPVQT